MRTRKTNECLGNPRKSYSEYGLDKLRVKELQSRCRAGLYSDEMLRKACAGFEWLAPWILLSVKQNRSYDRLEYDLTLGRILVGKTDFYGFRRKFYHNLDVMLRKECSA